MQWIGGARFGPFYKYTQMKIIFLHFAPKLTKLQLGMTHNEIFNIHSPEYYLLIFHLKHAFY